MPAFMAACRAGFCPWPAVSTWPRITSSTSSPASFARSRAALMATAPRSCAGRLANAPLNDPTGHLARRLQPALGPFSLLALAPVVALVARSRVDHTGDVAACGENEARVTGYKLRGPIGGLPRHDVVLATCQHIGGRVDRREVDPDAALSRLSGDAEIVFQVGVAHVPAVHGAGQIR